MNNYFFFYSFYFFGIVNKVVSYKLNMLDYLPDKIRLPLLDKLELIHEIRIRNNLNVVISTFNGLKLLYDGENKPISVDFNDIERIIERVTKRSIYAFNDCIKRGYISGDDGERIGLAGECVINDNKIITIKNFTSINIRIPHQVNGCSNEVFNLIKENCLKNLLIYSKPGMGKTTIIRDLVRNISNLERYNQLVIDERNEIIFNKCNYYGVDVMKNSTKEYCFENGIRSLSPDIIITDELYGQVDFNTVKKAIDCGVNVIASTHAVEITKLSPYIFDFYVKLDNFNVGKIEKIFKNENGKLVEC